MLSFARIFQAPKASKLVLTHFKLLSSQASVEWESAKPFESIPGIKNSFELIRLFGPGGKYQNLPLDKLVESFQRDYGTLAKFPGILGQRQMVRNLGRIKTDLKFGLDFIR